MIAPERLAFIAAAAERYVDRSRRGDRHTFSIYREDGRVIVWAPHWDREADLRRDGQRRQFLDLVDKLRAGGWWMTTHQERIWESKDQSAWRGAIMRRLRVAMRHGGRMIEVQFYADPNPEHRYPEHAINKRKYLPYLEQVRLDATLEQFRRWLTAYGYDDTSEPTLRTPWEELEWRVRSNGWWKAGDTNAFDRPRHMADNRGVNAGTNLGDRSNVEMRNGELRWFYDWGGRRRVGYVFHNINNMWWVVDGDRVTNIAGHDILPGDPRTTAPPPRFDPLQRPRRQQQILDRRVHEQDFEKAIPLRDILREANP